MNLNPAGSGRGRGKPRPERSAPSSYSASLSPSPTRDSPRLWLPAGRPRGPQAPGSRRVGSQAPSLSSRLRHGRGPGDGRGELRPGPGPGAAGRLSACRSHESAPGRKPALARQPGSLAGCQCLRLSGRDSECRGHGRGRPRRPALAVSVRTAPWRLGEFEQPPGRPGRRSESR